MIEALKWFNSDGLGFALWVVLLAYILRRKPIPLDELPTEFKIVVEHHHYDMRDEEEAP